MAIKRITTNLIKDSDIATVDIANNAITAAKITDGNITTAKLADLSVTAGKLAGTLDLTGKTITVATATTGDNDTSPASTAFVQQEIAALVDSSPDSLNTLNELAAALGDDASFSTTVTNSIATKLPLAGGTLTGALTGTSAAFNSGTTNIVATFTSTDSLGGIQLADNSGNVELVANANNFEVRNAGGSATMVVENGGNVGIGTDSPADTLHVVTDSSTTNDTVDVVRIEATSSGTPAVGFGAVIDFRAERAGASSDSMGRVGFVADTMTASRIDGAYVVETAVDGTYSERIRIDSSGRFIVGSTSAFNSSSFCVDQSGLGQFRRDGTPLIIRRDGSDGGLIDFEKDGSTVGSIGTEGGDIVIGTGDTAVQFADSLDCIRPFTSSGSGNGGRDNAIDLGASGQRFKDLYLSGGAYLGGTGSANKLDDYEEGTFTPSCTNLGTTVFSAKYTKVGDLVTLVVYLETTTANSGTSGNATFTGLPFTSQSYGWSVGSLSIAASNPVNGTPLHVRVVANSSSIDLKKNNDTTMVGSDVDAGHIIWTVSYKAA